MFFKYKTDTMVVQLAECSYCVCEHLANPSAGGGI